MYICLLLQQLNPFLTMKEFVVTTLGFLVVLCIGCQWIASQTKSQLLSSLNPEFRRFQKIFFAPYLFALFADWLQGPYVYRYILIINCITTGTRILS